MARYFTYLITLASVILAVFVPQTAYAQSCPDGATQVTPITGTYPADMIVCAADWFSIAPLENEDIPCEEYYNLTITPFFVNQLWFLPPGGLEPNTDYQLAFYYAIEAPYPEQVDDYVLEWGLEYPSGLYGTPFQIPFEDLPHQTIPNGLFSEIWLYSVFAPFSSFPLNDQNPTGVTIYLPAHDSGPIYHYMSSIRLGQSIPFGCDSNYPTPTPPVFPTSTLPPTWTPNASGTPAPTFTPRPMTPTPGPTQPGNLPTITPYATRTPFVFPVLPSEPTATTWPLPTLADIVFPTVDFPDVLAIDTPVPVTVQVTNTTVISSQATLTWQMVDEANAIATRWAVPIDFAQENLGSDGLGDFSGYAITGTVPVSNTSENFGLALSAIVYPVRFLRTIQIYMPNTWILVLVIIGCFLIIVATTIIKFGMAILGDVVAVIRDIWEAIPLN